MRSSRCAHAPVGDMAHGPTWCMTAATAWRACRLGCRRTCRGLWRMPWQARRARASPASGRVSAWRRQAMKSHGWQSFKSACPASRGARHGRLSDDHGVRQWHDACAAAGIRTSPVRLHTPRRTSPPAWCVAPQPLPSRRKPSMKIPLTSSCAATAVALAILGASPAARAQDATMPTAQPATAEPAPTEPTAPATPALQPSIASTLSAAPVRRRRPAGPALVRRHRQRPGPGTEPRRRQRPHW